MCYFAMLMRVTRSVSGSLFCFVLHKRCYVLINEILTSLRLVLKHQLCLGFHFRITEKMHENEAHVCYVII